MFLDILGSVTEIRGLALEEMINHDPAVILSDIVSQVCRRP